MSPHIRNCPSRCFYRHCAWHMFIGLALAPQVSCMDGLRTFPSGSNWNFIEAARSTWSDVDSHERLPAMGRRSTQNSSRTASKLYLSKHRTNWIMQQLTLWRDTNRFLYNVLPWSGEMFSIFKVSVRMLERVSESLQLIKQEKVK